MCTLPHLLLPIQANSQQCRGGYSLLTACPEHQMVRAIGARRPQYIAISGSHLECLIPQWNIQCEPLAIRKGSWQQKERLSQRDPDIEILLLSNLQHPPFITRYFRFASCQPSDNKVALKSKECGAQDINNGCVTLVRLPVQKRTVAYVVESVGPRKTGRCQISQSMAGETKSQLIDINA